MCSLTGRLPALDLFLVLCIGRHFFQLGLCPVFEFCFLLGRSWSVFVRTFVYGPEVDGSRWEWVNCAVRE